MVTTNIPKAVLGDIKQTVLYVSLILLGVSMFIPNVVGLADKVIGITFRLILATLVYYGIRDTFKHHYDVKEHKSGLYEYDFDNATGVYIFMNIFYYLFVITTFFWVL